MNQIYPLIEFYLKQPCYESFELLQQEVLSENKSNSLQAALKLALRSNDIGEAFMVGYRCALQALLPELKQDQWAAMCVSEQQGNHPKLLRTVVTDSGRVTGHKSFITMADLAKQLIVIAKIDSDENKKPTLKAILIDQPESGLTVELMPPLPMVPNVRHGQILLEQCDGKVLAGDGYTDYSKRFRTLEDAHVFMAFTGLIFRKSIELKLEKYLAEQCLMLMSGLLSLRESLEEKQNWSHLMLAGCFKQFEQLCGDFEEALKASGDEFYNLWLRDKKLFTIAAKARKVRDGKALEELLDLL